ncbi:MerC family mercury resistance protein [Polyangium sp. 15x6]|uniref:MerC family mercury resistance protein n=1 Tax=Polyangium sp. 15x6 TaxID=3042687 RepID=UPI00249BE7A4|nr:MerC family mercury resistance protein [Polyangium sp. 15x6]MDI3289445.1 MerC family mercury resistance protein [Polyangium sp. 15x6]
MNVRASLPLDTTQTGCAEPTRLEHRAHAEDSHEACCAHHRHHSRPAGKATPGRSSLLSVVLPVLACAVCPTCLGAWAQALSALGVGFVVTEAQHHVLLVVAVAVTLVVSVRRYVRSRRKGPLALSLAGSIGLVASHLLGEIEALAWASIVVLVAASIWQHRALPSPARPAKQAA